MPRYFFNVYNGDDLHDEMGTELKNMKEMRFFMMTMATEMLLEEKHRMKVWQMEVLDEGGRIVGSMNFGVDETQRQK